MRPIEILVVDHNTSDLFLTRAALSEEAYPINVRVAPSSHRASQMLAGNRFQPDLVIFDVNFAKPLDLSVLESIDPYIPVVVFTSSFRPTDEQIAMDLGVVEYIKKPARPAEFVEAVSRIVRQWTLIPVA